MFLSLLSTDHGVGGGQTTKHPRPALLPAHGLMGRHQMARSWHAPARLSHRCQEDVPESMLSCSSRQAGIISIFNFFFLIFLFKFIQFYLL